MSGGKIDCKEANRLIPGFVNRTLSHDETVAFVDHVKTCKACKEELTFQYLVFRGFDEAVASGEYNLITKLESEIKDAELRIEERRRRNLVSFGASVLALAFVMFVVFVLLF